MGKESLRQIRPIELTRHANSPKLGGGVIFMANEGGEGAPRVDRSAAASRRIVTKNPANAPAVRPNQLPAELAAQAEIATLRRALQGIVEDNDPSIPQFVRAQAANAISEKLTKLGVDVSQPNSSQIRAESTSEQEPTSIAKRDSKILDMMGIDAENYEPEEIIKIANLLRKQAKGQDLTPQDEMSLKVVHGWTEAGEDYLLDVVGMAGGTSRGHTTSSSGSTSGSSSSGPTTTPGGGSGVPPGAPPPPVPPGGPGSTPPGGDPIKAEGERVMRELGRGSYELYLSLKDIGQLSLDPNKWLEDQYDKIYRNAKQGNILTSPVLTMLQQKYALAAYLLTELEPPKPEAVVDRFTEGYNNRLHSIYLRSSLENGNLDQARETAIMLKTHGLLSTLGLDHGNVAKMWSAMDELLESERLAQRGLINDVEGPLLDEEGKLMAGFTPDDKEEMRGLLRKLLHRPIDPKTGEPEPESPVGKEMRENSAKEGIYHLLNRLATSTPPLSGPLIDDYRDAINAPAAKGLTGEKLNEYLDSKLGARIESLKVNMLGQERVAREMGQFHVNEEMMSRLQDLLIVKQFTLAKNGAGVFRKDYKDAVARLGLPQGTALTPDQEMQIKTEVMTKITRSVRTAYDAFVGCERQGVIVARGRALGYTDMLKSEPITLFGVFNIKDMLLHRKQLTAREQHLLAALAKGYARSDIRGKLGKSNDAVEKAALTAILKNPKELEEYGIILFKDVAEVSDFFSSSWRIRHIIQAINGVTTYRNKLIYEENKRRAVAGGTALREIDPEDFALSLKFPKAENNPGSELTPGKYERIPTLIRIAEIRPEEIVRLYRERAVRDPRTAGEIRAGDIKDPRTAEQIKLDQQFGRFFADPVFDGLRVTAPDRTVDNFRTYDKFKDVLGPLINGLRQDAYHEEFNLALEQTGPRAMRIGADGFNLQESVQVVSYFRSANKLLANNLLENKLLDALGLNPNTATDAEIVRRVKDMYYQFTTVAKDGLVPNPKSGGQKADSGVIYDLNKSLEFADIYKRPTFVDDALIDLLEDPPDPEHSGLISLSAQISNDPKGDGLVRAYNDLAAGIEGSKALMKFLKAKNNEERLEAALALGQACYDYSGQNLRAAAIRYTYGGTIQLSKMDFTADVVGFAKGPLRTPISPIERLLGLAEKPMSIDERFNAIQDISYALVQSVDMNASPDEIAAEQADANKFINDLMYFAEANWQDFAKRKAVSGLLAILLAALIEGARLVDPKALTQQAA